jgi:hypothetical protein
VRVRTAIVIGAVLATAMGVAAQQPASGSLTLQDYNEIQQLYARYAHGIDTHAEDGQAYANTYTDDGVLDVGVRKYEGRAALINLAKPPGDPTLVHVVSNVAIEPSPEGARVVANMAQLTLGEKGKPPVLRGIGRYEDVVVRTPNGWRFKYKKWTVLSAPEKPAQ